MEDHKSDSRNGKKRKHEEHRRDKSSSSSGHRDHRKDHRRHHHKSSNNMVEPSSGTSSPVAKKFTSEKDRLNERMRSYLEENKHREYIDINDMSKKLHNTHSEYKRIKFKIFVSQVNEAFDKVIQAEMKAAQEETEKTEVKSEETQSQSNSYQNTMDRVAQVAESNTYSKPGPKSKKKKVPISKPATPLSNSNASLDSKTNIELKTELKTEPNSNQGDSDNSNANAKNSADEAERKPAKLTVEVEPNSKDHPAADTVEVIEQKTNEATIQEIGVTPKTNEVIQNPIESAVVQNGTSSSPIQSLNFTPQGSNDNQKIIEAPEILEEETNDIFVIDKIPMEIDLVDNDDDRKDKKSSRTKTPAVKKPPDVGATITNLYRQDTPKKGDSSDIEVISVTPISTTPAVKTKSLPKTSVSVIQEPTTPKSLSTPKNPTLTTAFLAKSSVKQKSDSKKNSKNFSIETPPVIPKLTFNDIGGCEETIEEVYRSTRHLSIPQNYAHLRILPPRGGILHGPPGCGKTMMAFAIAGTLNIPMISVTGTELISGISGDSESKIRQLFEQAKSSAPCLLFIDGIDVLAKRRENAQKEMELRIVSQLLASLDDLNECGFDEAGRVFVLGATDRLETIDPALRTGKRLEREMAMGIPDLNARKKILEVMCKEYKFGDDIDFQTLATLTPGFVGSDLKALITAAASFAEDRHYLASESTYRKQQGSSVSIPSPEFYEWMNSSAEVQSKLKLLSVTSNDFQRALKLIKPSALREGFATVPNVSFEDIGALDHIRHELEMAVVAPVKYPELIAELGLDVPSGVLLCGPPGCGKTLLAKAVANQAGINFISVKGPEMINMYVGESERAVRQVFQRARNSSPCVIFFDEIDSIAPKRSGNDQGSSNRLVNQLLTEMDGVEGRKGVYVMAATNRVDMLDSAILRPGRLTNIFFVDLPSASGREDILKKMTKNGTKPKLAGDVNLADIACLEKCEGFSGADLGNLVRRAAQFRMEEICKFGNFTENYCTEVSLRHFKKALSFIKPSVSGKQKRVYETMKQKYASGFLVNEEEGDEKMIVRETLEEAVEKVSCVEVNEEFKFKAQMKVRIGDTCQDPRLTGKKGHILDFSDDGKECTIRTDDKDDNSQAAVVKANVSNLEPFVPEKGELAKFLLTKRLEQVVQVVEIEEDSDDAKVKHVNGVKEVVQLDHLCKIVKTME